MDRLTNKAKFRSRKLDPKRQLPIKRHYDTPDLDEENAANRTSFEITTGVEKEEEEVEKQRHL